jgi:hypothetical protein
MATAPDDRSSGDDSEKVEPTIRDALIGLGIGLLLVYLGTRVPYRIASWMLIGLGLLFVVVMSGFVIVVVWERASPGIRRVMARVRGHVRHDARLGKLTRNVKGEYWEGAFTSRRSSPDEPVPAKADRQIELLIDGLDEPDPKLVGRAREFVADFATVQRRVDEFLADELRRETDPELATQIAGLRVSAIRFFSGKRSGRVDIDFRGPDEDLYWSCTYADGKPQDLWYDS